MPSITGKVEEWGIRTAVYWIGSGETKKSGDEEGKEERENFLSILVPLASMAYTSQLTD